ncbi:SAM-dependent methyltransferase [Flagellimonas eckloniae]|uniref:SAM-dependent methyltransferase n=1 Tax=Flagellimonas eckloniae TaxID=346185 RepID=A0A0Q1BGB9_9FLAO|nr:SAM-dependent methyltransferase [Allomuricauda eckloniae]
MNKLLLNTGVQDFIKNNINTDIVSVLLKKQLFEGISQKELFQQLEAKKKCEYKLPSWFNTTNIYYPNKVNIEQTSSEQTAAYKAKLLDGKSLLDLTGGFGVDAYYFSKQLDTVFHCEIDQELSEITNHNFKILDQNNIICVAEDGFQFLKNTTKKFDWIYIDPSRRDDVKGKVFLLKDCLPNLPENLSFLFKKTKNILIKTSPLLDISQSIKELDFVKEIHIVAINNEVKELLYILEHGFKDEILINTINLTKNQEVHFSFIMMVEAKIVLEHDTPKKYLYEPNAAILKSGGFKTVAKTYKIKKLHQHSHLYTSDALVDFPGRRFRILETIPYSKNRVTQLGLKKANVTTRNFPSTVAELRKRHKIKDGGDVYLFFTTDVNNKLIVLYCEKA